MSDVPNVHFSSGNDYKGIRRVLTYGTFDLLHYGHIRLLRRAAALGDYLVVALSTDEFNASKASRASTPTGCARRCSRPSATLTS